MITVRNLEGNPKATPEPITRQSELAPAPTNGDRLHQEAKRARGLGATVEITGQWVWAQWPSIPSASTRQELKAHGWIWCHGKGKWAWRGVPSHSHKAMPWDYIVNKYGIQTEEPEKALIRKQ